MSTTYVQNSSCRSCAPTNQVDLELDLENDEAVDYSLHGQVADSSLVGTFGPGIVTHHNGGLHVNGDKLA